MWLNNPKKSFRTGIVEPQYQGREIGPQIYEKLAGELESLHAITAWTDVKENMPVAVAFVERRGFKEKKRAWESRLKPSEVDLKRFRKYTDEASKEGIKITTLPEAQAEGTRP